MSSLDSNNNSITLVYFFYIVPSSWRAYLLANIVKATVPPCFRNSFIVIYIIIECTPKSDTNLISKTYKTDFFRPLNCSIDSSNRSSALDPIEGGLQHPQTPSCWDSSTTHPGSATAQHHIAKNGKVTLKSHITLSG